jgi:hypothetical protein
MQPFLKGVRVRPAWKSPFRRLCRLLHQKGSLGLPGTLGGQCAQRRVPCKRTDEGLGKYGSFSSGPHVQVGSRVEVRQEWPAACCPEDGGLRQSRLRPGVGTCDP